MPSARLPRATLPALFSLAIHAGCAPRAASPPQAPAASLTEVPAPAASAETAALLAVLAAAPVRPCYEAALSRDPRAHGEVVVRVILGDAGAVAAVEGVLSTLDDAASACVGDAARGLQFSPTTRPGFAVVYPYVFVSGSTPPEVTRALKLRYGLAKEDLDANLADPKKPPPPGVVVTF